MNSIQHQPAPHYHYDNAMASTKAEEDKASLKATVDTITILIAQLQTTVPANESTDGSKPNNVNALELAHDSASLIKAHSTKLSLLIINKPFTATAISTVLRELAAGPLPGLASAIQSCTATKYTEAMSTELQWRARKVFIEFGTLVKAIPLDGKILSEDAKNGTGKVGGKGSLTSTGVVWEACDGVAALKRLGVAGLVIKKAEEYRDLLKDALEELQEWGEEEGDEDESSGENSEVDDAQAAVDNLFGFQRHIPSEDPEKIRPRLESSQKRLRLVITMYTAIIKRRFKTLPHLPLPELPSELKEKSNEDPGIVTCLDEVLEVLKKIPDITDELASAFYELDGEEIDKRMDECFFKGFAAAELLLRNWEGQKDEFTTWVSYCFLFETGWLTVHAGNEIPACNEEGLVMRQQARNHEQLARSGTTVVPTRIKHVFLDHNRHFTFPINNSLLPFIDFCIPHHSSKDRHFWPNTRQQLLYPEWLFFK